VPHCSASPAGTSPGGDRRVAIPPPGRNTLAAHGDGDLVDPRPPPLACPRVLQRNRPEDLGPAPIDDPVAAGTTLGVKAAEPAEPDRLSRDAWINLLLVGGFYFFDKFIRYALWSWVPYFLKLSYGMGSGESAAFSTVFELAGLPAGSTSAAGGSPRSPRR
jgi:hypothetical protein